MLPYSKTINVIFSAQSWIGTYAIAKIGLQPAAGPDAEFTSLT